MSAWGGTDSTTLCPHRSPTSGFHPHEMQICRRPRFEGQIRLVVNENDVHVVAHVLNGIVDLSQLCRVRPLLHGSTLLTVTDGVTVFAFCTRSSIFSLISWVGTFPTSSRVPPTITLFLTYRLSARHTYSIITPMSSSVAPDFLRTMNLSFPLTFQLAASWTAGSRCRMLVLLLPIACCLSVRVFPSAAR